MPKRQGLSNRHENKLWRVGFQYVAGVDEVGRGAWAGPLVAAAVVFPVDASLPGIHDSKLLTARQRERRFADIIRSAHSWGIGIIEPGTIDRIGLTAANQLAFVEALRRLPNKPDYILTDALSTQLGRIPSQAVIHGDRTVLSIAAASIIAKVFRDWLMRRYDLTMPQYGFARHMGYGTPQHRRALSCHGPTPIHRLSFAPLRRR